MLAIRDEKLSVYLETKLRENQERRERDQLLKVLPFSLTSKLESAEFIYSDEYFERFPVPPGQRFTESKFTSSSSFTSFIHQDFDDICHVKDYLRIKPETFEAPLFCWFGKGPAFIINEQIDLTMISEIENLSGFRIYIAERNFAKGFIFDHYLGYLPEDRSTNANEIVFEIVNFSVPC